MSNDPRIKGGWMKVKIGRLLFGCATLCFLALVVLTPLSMLFFVDQWQFEGEGVRAWWFRRNTVIGQFPKLDPEGAAVSYYIRFQDGTASQVAAMSYHSRCRPAEAIEAFKAFCFKKGLIIPPEEEKPGYVMCLPPGEVFSGKFESSYIDLSVETAGTGSRISAGEVGMNLMKRL
jgi:hypothetical protein